MEPNSAVMWSTLGVGLGLGLGLASDAFLKSAYCNGAAAGGRSLSELLELELMEQVVDGKNSGVTFDAFPYYLNEQTRALLTNAAYVHLKQKGFCKYTRNLSPASQTILLTGPQGAEAYQQMLAKALAHYFEAKLLLLDLTEFVSKLQKKYSDLKPNSEFPALVSKAVSQISTSLSGLASAFTQPAESRATASRERDSSVDGAVKAKKHFAVSRLRRTNSLGFEESYLFDALFKVLEKVSKTSPIVLYLRDVEKLTLNGSKASAQLVKRIKKLGGPVLVLGSKIAQDQQETEGAIAETLQHLFSYAINIKPPQDNADLVSWRSQLEEDMKTIQCQDNRNHILEVLAANDVECDDLGSLCLDDAMLLGSFTEEVVVSAISHHLMNIEMPEYRSGRLIISAKSLAYGLELFKAGDLDKEGKLQTESTAEDEAQETTANVETPAKSEAKTEPAKAEAPKPAKSEASKADGEKKSGDAKPAATPAKPAEAPDNEFEKRIRPEVIPAGEIGVNFQDIGALDNVKESLQELVMLPLRRPELFKRGGLIKPCKGILLFGPPGTGKTMLAKAVATEAGASFINVTMSSITSKWFGEDEKNVKAVFSLASKVSPTIIFIDEVDSMLGQRSRVGEHEAMRKLKNEFMAHWDGLLTKGGERVLVLAATNRPFDLDDAIIRRFERRIMVGLPNAENREKILRAILSKELLADDFDFREVAAMTEGYSGSDLKNLCMTAAYRPVRELLKKEKEEKKKEAAAAASVSDAESEKSSTQQSREQSHEQKAQSEDASEDNAAVSEESEPVISFRPLNMEDMKEARKQVSVSFASEGSSMKELEDWNRLYGEGGSRKQQQLTYFM